MKAKLPWILLVISVAFNAFFIVGGLHAKSRVAKAHTLEGRAALFAKRLELDDQQRKVLDGLVEEARRLRQTSAPRLEAFLAEVTKDQPDEKALTDLVNGPAASQDRLDRVALIRKVVALLRPEQRDKWVEMVKKRTSASS
jgi:Spy/CpxP family protein refolding chaperone